MRLAEGSPFPEDERSRQWRRAQDLGMAFVNLSNVTISSKTLALIPTEVSREWRILAVKQDGGTLWVAVDEPNEESVRRVREAMGLRIIPVLVMPDALDDALARLSRQDSP